jgi:acetate---CoA ligase (ADP-forming) subunit beta
MSDDAAVASRATRTRSEAWAKALLRGFDIPFPDEREVVSPDEVREAADALGYPVVLKLNGDRIAHKTERGLVRLGLADGEAVSAAARELLAARRADDGEVTLLVAPMLRANRELIAGLSHDPQFGMTIMLGVGGILAEAVGDVSIRLVPITAVDAEEMIEELSSQPLLGAFRGEPAVDRTRLVALLLALSRVAEDRPEVVAVDLNPVLVVDGAPVAVDALVEVEVEVGR